jgi:hypothetical protein
MACATLRSNLPVQAGIEKTNYKKIAKLLAPHYPCSIIQGTDTALLFFV